MLQAATSIQHALSVIGLVTIVLSTPLWIIRSLRKPWRSSSWSQFQQDWRNYQQQFYMSVRSKR
jgi:hypothetical protein